MSEMEKTLDDAKDEINRLELTLQQEKTTSSKLQLQVCSLVDKAGDERL